MFRRTALSAILLLITLTAQAQQSTIPDYDTARDEYFWRLFYVFGGETVYCGARFGPYKVLNLDASWPSVSLTVEHAYPADWIAEARGCENRNSCTDQTYRFAEADLHNLWPAINRVNSSRSDNPFGEDLAGTESRFGYCPTFRRTYGAGARVVPRDAVRGDLARSILYMMDAYSLPEHVSRDMLLRWHRADPPNEHEQWRNYVIEQLQGSRNPYVDGRDLQ